MFKAAATATTQNLVLAGKAQPKQADRLLKQLPLSQRKRQQEIRRLILLDMQQGRVRL